MSKNKKDIAEEKVVLARMIRDFSLYTAQEVHDLGLGNEEFITEDNKFSLKYVAPYERKGRKDRQSDGSSKPRVKVRGFFRKIISLHDHRELYGVDISLCEAEHRMHQGDSEWHNTWKELVRDFCEIEERFYPGGIKTKKGYKIADAYYAETNTVIEFQKSFSDEALSKTEFYKNENLHLIWIFYLPTLSVFENNNLYNIREDNVYNFFRIEDFMPDFFEKNIVFVQDKTDKIYLVKNMKRVESTDELEATVRYFDMNLRFNTSLEFVYWLRNDWESSPYYKGNSINDELKSIEEILIPFKDSNEKMFYLQNCTKNDINGNKLIYCFVKDEGKGFRMNQHGYISYRSYIGIDGYYHANKSWEETNQSPTSKKWILLATNKKRFNNPIDL